MDNRWEYFFATHEYQDDEILKCELCAQCAGRLWLEGAPGAVVAACPPVPRAPPPPGPPVAPPLLAPPASPAPTANVGAAVAPPPLLAPSTSAALSSNVGDAVAPPPPKRQRTMVEELKDLSALLSSGAVTQEEFQSLKANVLRGC